MSTLGKHTPLPWLKQPKIYFSVSSEGYGHSSRALAMAPCYPHSQVLVGTYGYALERIQAAGFECVAIEQEYELMGASGQFDVKQTIFGNQASLFGLAQVIESERDLMVQHGITLVVADGRIAPVIAASHLGIPCLAVTNQSDFYPFFDRHESTFVKLFGKSFEWWLQNWLLHTDEILIPDFHPPDTVCLMNLSPNFHVKKRTRFTGPLVAWSALEIDPVERPVNAAGESYEAYVVVSMGGHAFRRPMLDAVLRIAPQCPHIAFDLLTSLPVSELPQNVRNLGHVSNAPSYYKAADAIITQAGHSTAMELLTLGVPSVVVPDQRQIEQENNAKRLDELGVSIQVTYDQLEHEPHALSSALDNLLKQDSYRRKALQFQKKSIAQQGASHIRTLFDEYAQRLVTY